MVIPIYYKIELNDNPSVGKWVHLEDVRKFANTIIHNWYMMFNLVKIVEHNGKHHTSKEIDVWVDGKKTI